MKLNNKLIPNEIECSKPAIPELPPPCAFFIQLPVSLKTNYLIPRLTNPFLNMTKLDPNCPHPKMPNLPLPPPIMSSTFFVDRQKSPLKSAESDEKLLDSQPMNITDKKLKKKLKKNRKKRDKKKN